MDPFATLNAVANIIDFVVYTRNIYHQVREIRASAAGITKKDADIVWSATEVEGMVEDITASIKSMEEASRGPLSTSDRKIRDIGEKCRTLAAELKESIEGKAQKNRSNVFSAAKSVLLGTWRPSEVDQKVKELEALQSNLFKQLLIHIRYSDNTSSICFS
jgi:hypothetical protein